MAKTKVENATRFSKNQIISSEKFKNRRDILNVLLEDDKTYTNEEILEVLENKMKGKVK